MKIVLVTGSPRKGATEGMADAFQAAAEARGVEVVRFNASKMDVAPCKGCDACMRMKSRCVFNDEFSAFTDALLAADGIVFATPLYWYTWSAQIKKVIDRFCSYLFINGGSAFKGKVAALIASCGEPTEEVFGGLIFSYERILAMLDMKDVGRVLLTGVFERPDAYKATDACVRAAALAEKMSSNCTL